ncbi:M48 family metalloprotease, partial [Patescibacteria group bacterium]|nr:M48 family metalloprotease [Patescibacteria group bacterium]
MYTHKSSNITKTWLLVGIFFAIVVGIGYFFSMYYGNPGILTFAIIFSVVMNITSFWYSDKIALSMARAVPATVEKYPELNRIVENLSITAGLPKPRVYIIADMAPNAFATGRNASHAAVAVTEGLLSMLDRAELEGVIAHELAHVGNKDILLQSMVAVLVGFIAILADMFTRSMLFGGGNRDDDNKGGNILMIVGLVFIILSPIIATLIQLAISRKREYLADASGALLTRYPEGLASALKKISSYGRPMAHASNATAHMYISNPFGAKAKQGLSGLFMTHPPVEKRLLALH